jgi:putative heme-binding domain-containing protein
LLDALRRLGADRTERMLRDRVARLLHHNLGQDFGYLYGCTTNEPQTKAVARLTAHLRQRFPEEAAHSLKSSAEQIAALRNLLSLVKWETGARERGKDLFQKHSCAGCHNTRTAVGPDLAGIAKRFSRDDLFTAVALPSRDVSPRYNTTLIETTRGKVVSGLIVYESADGVTLRDSTNQVIRIEANEIALRQELATSLMPSGLLDEFQPQDLADLYAYLRGL